MKLDLRNGDALELIKTLPDKSVDLVVTDPPYYKVVDEDWDSQWDQFKDFLKWCDVWFKEVNRVLKDNGSFYVFAMDRYSAFLWIEIEKFNFSLLNEIIWHKTNHAANKGWHINRSYTPSTERILFFEKKESQNEWNANGLYGRLDNIARNYMNKERNKSNVSITDIKHFFNNEMARHYFGNSQWVLPNEQSYERLKLFINAKARGLGTTEELAKLSTEDLKKLVGNLTFFKADWKDLKEAVDKVRDQYKENRRYFKQDENFQDVWTSSITGTNEKTYHPTQKPLWMLKRIIKTSCPPDGVVLDLFMGSGTTGVACKELNRDFIGFELDKKYFEISKKRIENTHKVSE